MKKISLLLAGAAIALLPTAGHAGSGTDALPPGVDKAGAINPTTPFTWNGTGATAANISGFLPGAANQASCGKGTNNYCEYVLIQVDSPFPGGFTKTTYVKEVDIRIDQFSPATLTDFDLRIYESDANGTKGFTGSSMVSAQDVVGELQAINSGGQPFDRPEHVTLPVTSTRVYNADGTVKSEVTRFYYLAEIVYFQAVNSSYKGTAKFI